MEDSKKTLFHKFIKDECSPEEIEQLLGYIHSSVNDADNRALMDKVWDKLSAYPSVKQSDKDQQFKIILDRSSRERGAKTRYLLSIPGLRMAASFIGFLLVSSLVYLQFVQDSVVTYETGFGETREITLPDGSEVLLNNNSTLSYHRNWHGQGVRSVELVGEAFFSVVHTQDDRKFTVRTSDDFSVEVLGTRFNVNNRRHATEVILNEGKVKLNINTADEKQEILMGPGELVAYSQTTRQYLKKLVDTKAQTSWKDNMLIFDKQTLEEIALILQDNYGYTIQFASKEIGTYKFTGSIPTNKVEVLFAMLAKSFDLKIEKEDKAIWIKHNS